MSASAEGKSIYVESRVRAPMDELWRLTQEPDRHERWDLRFSGIEYLPRLDPAEPQRFRYRTRIGFGLEIAGEGESVGERGGPDGRRTSALRFWSADPKSLIREGSGYWQYLPTADGIRFLTRYGYRVRFGAVGRRFDAWCFRPLIGWATAWSFDRLRLWLERGLDPAVALRIAVAHAIARGGVAFVWLYQGAVPKLLRRHPDELALTRDAGVPNDLATVAVILLGGAEVALGLVVLIRWGERWPLVLTAGLMALATVGVAVNSPAVLGAAFNPVTLNVALLALAIGALVLAEEAPSARRTRRQPPEGDDALDL